MVGTNVRPGPAAVARDGGQGLLVWDAPPHPGEVLEHLGCLLGPGPIGEGQHPQAVLLHQRPERLGARRRRQPVDVCAGGDPERDLVDLARLLRAAGVGRRRDEGGEQRGQDDRDEGGLATSG